jgi:alpha-tubulin suppressor-like RCC1 family protein
VGSQQEFLTTSVPPNPDGQFCLGHGMGVTSVQYPTQIQSLHGEMCKDVAANSHNSFAITEKKCYVWGTQGSLLGNGSADNISSAVPLCCPSLQGDIVSIHAGLTHVGVVLKNNVFMWGSNQFGESSPNNDQNPIPIPREVEGLSDGKFIRSLALGDRFTLALTSEGKVYGWGTNTNGQLGIGVTKQSCGRVLISALASRHIVEIIAGQKSGGCRTIDKEYFSWGENGASQLGHADSQMWTIPRLLNTTNILNDITMRPSRLFFGYHSNLSILTFEVSQDELMMNPQEALLKDIEAQLNNESISDVVIVAQGKKIYASKVIFVRICCV